MKSQVNNLYNTHLVLSPSRPEPPRRRKRRRRRRRRWRRRWRRRRRRRRRRRSI
jgi:hypothetical protein